MQHHARVRLRNIHHQARCRDVPSFTRAFYTCMTQYLGFPNYGTKKGHGPGPYGEPRYLGDMLEIVQPDDSGGFRFDLSYFTTRPGIEMTWDEARPHIGRIFSDRMIERFGPPREPGERDHPRPPRPGRVAAEMSGIPSVPNPHGLHDKTRSDRLCLRAAWHITAWRTLRSGSDPLP